MVQKVLSSAQFGINGQIIEIEADVSNSLPGITIVGLPDKAVEEARERIKSAIKNSGYNLPPKRFTINLIPADIPKRGSAYDLPIAISILAASAQIELPDLKSLFLGELSLSGEIKSCPGALIATEVAKSSGCREIFLSVRSAYDAAILDGIKIFGARNLKEVVEHLLSEKEIKAMSQHIPAVSINEQQIDMSDVIGQHSAKRAMVVAIAGGHNVILNGPPGIGKTMLARASAGLLPPLEVDEYIELTKLYGLVQASGGFNGQRPFRSPHHTASDTAMIGGGRQPKPGEISLSHRGILFLDEFAEFPRHVLEVLRQPLEEGVVSLARAEAHYSFPARFMLIAAQNPCPCGYYGDPKNVCHCNLSQIHKYQHKISGPLLDRIDLVVTMSRTEKDEMASKNTGQSSEELSAQILEARKLQKKRFSDSNILLNSEMNAKQITKYCKLNNEANDLLDKAAAQLDLSYRNLQRVIKVAQTIADLKNQSIIDAACIAEAVQYRPVRTLARA